MSNPLAAKMAADIIKWLTAKHGPPPPGYKEQLVAAMSKVVGMCPKHGLLVMQAFCVCEECQEKRAAEVRGSVGLARRFQDVILRNAREPCMN